MFPQYNLRKFKIQWFLSHYVREYQYPYLFYDLQIKAKSRTYFSKTVLIFSNEQVNYPLTANYRHPTIRFLLLGVKHQLLP